MPSVWARLQSLGRPDWYVEFPSSYTQATKPMAVGRFPGSALTLTDNKLVSNKHIVLEQKFSEKHGGRVVVLHETSSNGTCVNGIRYEKGQTVELTPGTEIIFPCEDNATKLDFTFEFQVFSEEIDGKGEKSNARMQQSSSQPTADWSMLQEQCDELAREAARLAASVYSNSDKLKQLNETIKPGEASFRDPLEEAARGMLGLLKVAEDRLRVLGDIQTADSLAHHKWELTLSKLGVLESSSVKHD